MSGSAVVLEQDEGHGGGQQPQQQRKGPTVEIVAEPEHTGPTAEEALAASRKAIQDAESAQRAARQEAQQAQQELARVRASQQQDQAAVLASAVEASTAERDRLAHAWQAAMEAGDFPAASKHQADMMLATARLERASGELAMAKAGAEQRKQQGGAPAQPAVSSRSQQWINSKPAFNTHKDALLLKHSELLNDGVVPESPRYFRELDTEYERLTNAGSGGGGHTEMGNDQQRQGGGRQFDGAPPSRGGSGGSQGSVVQTLLGPVQVRTVNGQTMIQIPQNVRADFDEGAKVNQMSVADYAMEHVKAARERAAGGTGGLITEEGRKYS